MSKLSIHFNPETDLAPIPFNKRVCRQANEMKKSGLQWTPHVGCFVWDPDYHIAPDSPFPNRVYFILSLPRFFDLLGSKEAIYEKLVWLPTWHKAQLICRRLGIQMDGIAKSDDAESFDPCEALLNVYVSIKNALRKK
jgi:hypothetical protein